MSVTIKSNRRLMRNVERSRQDRAAEATRVAEEVAKRVSDTFGAENGRNFVLAEQAIEQRRQLIDQSGVTGVERAKLLAAIDRDDVALHTPTHGAYAFVGLDPHNDPRVAGTPRLPTTADIDRAMSLYHAIHTEIPNAAEAAREFARRHPDLVTAYRAGLSHLAAQPTMRQVPDPVPVPQPGPATKAFDALVQQYATAHKCSIFDAAMVVGRERKDLGDARNREMSLPIGLGGVSMTSR